MVVYRNVVAEDAAAICDHRRRMFAEMGTDADLLDAASDSFAVWLGPRLADGRYFGFVAEDGGAVVAGVGLSMYDWQPTTQERWCQMCLSSLRTGAAGSLPN